MRTWTRAPRLLPCGGCPAAIGEGDPVLVINNQAGRRVRCAACAARLFGEGPPPDLPEMSSPEASQTPRQPDFVRVGTMVGDYKLRQAGE